jgi:hypothetical protein
MACEWALLMTLQPCPRAPSLDQLVSLPPSSSPSPQLRDVPPSCPSPGNRKFVVAFVPARSRMLERAPGCLFSAVDRLTSA